MSTRKLKASVNYNDFEGTAAADHHDRRSLSDLAEKYGVDTERYLVFGLDMSMGEIRDDDVIGDPIVSILAADKQTVHAGSYDYLGRFAEQNGGVLPYVTFIIRPKLEEVLLCFKRLNVVLTPCLLSEVREYRLAE